jgi:hypothetical protein
LHDSFKTFRWAKLAQNQPETVNVAQIALFNHLLHQQALWEFHKDSFDRIGAYGLAIGQLHLQAPTRPVYFCPSSAARHQMSPPPHWQAMSLPTMLSELDSTPNNCVRISLTHDDVMDVLLAALALDLPCELWLSKDSFEGLRADAPKVGSKAFASLPMFGLLHAFTEDSVPNEEPLTITVRKAQKNHQARFALDWIF